MIPTALPLVNGGERSPVVIRVRERLNIPGSDELDFPLQHMLRGIQQLNQLTVTGCIDSATLAALDLYDF